MVCESKKLKFSIEQEASGLSSGLGIKTTLSKLPLVGPSFCFTGINKLIQDVKWNCQQIFISTS